MTTPDASTPTPEHDELCEWKGFVVDEEYECRCAARREATEIDPRLLAMRVKRVRQAEKALATVKHTLASYISEHVPSRCEIDQKTATTREVCVRPVDGFVLISCGHFVFACAEHGSRILRDTTPSHGTWCDGSGIPLHDGSAYGVTTEWIGL